MLKKKFAGKIRRLVMKAEETSDIFPSDFLNL